jgi:hypothetical protein
MYKGFIVGEFMQKVHEFWFSREPATRFPAKTAGFLARIGVIH